jgi:CubicO group peptidase (beta-lactamase class C family)
MFSTASDLFAFYQMMLNGGEVNGRRILSPASVEVMTLCHTTELESPSRDFETGTYYGLGWHVVCKPEGTQQLQSIGSFGHGGLLNTRGWVDPQKQLVTVFLTSYAPTPEEGPTAFHDQVHSFLALAAAAIAK